MVDWDGVGVCADRIFLADLSRSLVAKTGLVEMPLVQRWVRHSEICLSTIDDTLWHSDL